MGPVVCAAAERAVKSDLNQQGFLFESSIVTVNHFDYTANGVAWLLVFANKSGFENRTNRASISLGKCSATMGSTSVTKRFAKPFNGSGRKRAYPRRQGGKASNSLACVLKKQRMACLLLKTHRMSSD